ncbi:hypothetical protein [Faecalibaculum rodentium]|uniref:hypothetical protein n=1 Tax=Faecalibaculum rodentium TaxID=1702221 RepID=UPI0023EFDD31|nr:hypothetical protein [Faecalibaculum rodentium]
MKWNNLIFLLGISALISGCTGGCTAQSKTTIDPFENVIVEFVGMDGTGEARLKSDGISYAGGDEATQKLLDDIVYKFSPNKNLENGQTIKMKVVVNDDLYRLSMLEFSSFEEEITVSGLSGRVTSNEFRVKDILNQEPEIKDFEEYIIVDGIEIPSAWNLTDEEIQGFVEREKKAQSAPSVPLEEVVEAPKQEEWYQGKSETVTNRKSADFLSRDYAWNALTAYKDAYKYGEESSQEFTIRPLIEDGKQTGYRCIFRGDEDES